MRRSGWILPIAGGVLWLAAIGWPAAAAIGALPGGAESGVPARGLGELLARSIGWSLAVAAGAMAIGWLPGRALGQVRSRRATVLLATGALLPICLPSYLVFYAWWQAWPADSALHRWAIEHDLVSMMRAATLWLGLVCWSWPLVAWCVAGEVASRPAEHEELLTLDRAGTAARWGQRLRADVRGLLPGGLVVAVVTFNNTTCFDLAQIFTFGNELRALEALGATPRDTLGTAAPAVALAMAGAGSVWWLLGARPRRLATRTERTSRPVAIVAGVVWGATVLLPLALLATGLMRWAGPARVGEFVSLYGPGLVHTLLAAAGGAMLAVIVAGGLAIGWLDGPRWVRQVSHGMAVGWLIGAAVPGTVVAVALEAAWNRSLILWSGAEAAGQSLGGGAVQSEATLASIVYTSPVILCLGSLARFGFVAALLARWVAAREPRELADLRRLDDAGTLRRQVQASRPRLLAAATATLAVVFVLGVGEIAVTAGVQPPGYDLVTTSMLNDMHYQRPQTVMIGATVFVLIATAAAVVAAIVVAGQRTLGRALAPGAAAVGLIGFACFTGGCEMAAEDGPVPLETSNTFGAPGRGLGQFAYPRGIAVDRARGYVYVVDKSARVQRFDVDGSPHVQWQMPAWERGKPTGLNVSPAGEVFVADTHYHQVIVYDADGAELRRFGGYGTEPGRFIYPTDVEFGADGRLYVSEYGGNDRVQVFTPEGEYLFGFGTFGEGPGQLSRPQSMVFSPDRSELYIADSCNHRIVVTDPEGVVLRMFGTAGREPGRLQYPYDLMLLEDGSLLVCEFGNNRVQRFTAAGEPRGVYGRVGRGDGELQYPWGIDGSGTRVFVLDSGNNRVQVIAPPA
ncbi:MAG: SMP-30/gluconolactonase/LRE family protein [Planctomycetota bacterium]|jgi:ABC-type Fe3+ transport system permease subunit/sugar lactone lactonase YvrE